MTTTAEFKLATLHDQVAYAPGDVRDVLSALDYFDTLHALDTFGVTQPGSVAREGYHGTHDYAHLIVTHTVHVPLAPAVIQSPALVTLVGMLGAAAEGGRPDSRIDKFCKVPVSGPVTLTYESVVRVYNDAHPHFAPNKSVFPVAQVREVRAGPALYSISFHSQRGASWGLSKLRAHHQCVVRFARLTSAAQARVLRALDTEPHDTSAMYQHFVALCERAES